MNCTDRLVLVAVLYDASLWRWDKQEVTLRQER